MDFSLISNIQMNYPELFLVTWLAYHALFEGTNTKNKEWFAEIFDRTIF
jgi:hypothetical protein